MPKGKYTLNDIIQKFQNIESLILESEGEVSDEIENKLLENESDLSFKIQKTSTTANNSAVLFVCFPITLFETFL